MDFRHVEPHLDSRSRRGTLDPGSLYTTRPEHPQGSMSRLNTYESTAVRLHPLKIKPAGNAYAANGNSKSEAGLLAKLPDELLVQILEYLDATALQRIQCTCRALYAFSRLEDLWKTLFVE